MSIRVSTQLELVAGFDNQLTNKIFGGPLLAEIIDTLAHATPGLYQLDGNELDTPLAFGDVDEARLVYLEGDGEFSVAFGGGAATHAQRDGVGASYPTTFVGGETLNLKIDGVVVAVVFTAADQTRDQVAARINFVAALAGFLVQPVAFQNAAQLRLKSPTTGVSSSVEVLAGGTATAALGLVVGVTAGVAGVPGTSPLNLFRPADPSGAAAAQGVKSYLLATCRCTSITVSNLTSALLNLKVFIAGDLVVVPC